LRILVTGGAGCVGSPAAIMHFAAFAYVGESVREPPLNSLNDIGESRDPQTHRIPLVLAAARDRTPVRIFGDDDDMISRTRAVIRGQRVRRWKLKSPMPGIGS
jgi:UDP-glucose 4-epimerase